MEESKRIVDQLASSLGRRDEQPNIELAHAIAKKEDTEAVEILIRQLNAGASRIQNDCIKVLYELGAIRPDLIADEYAVFLDLLGHKNNRLQWGAMTALASITAERPEEIFQHLPEILEAARKGSVITRDNAVNILVTLANIPRYAVPAGVFFVEILLQSPVNQLPAYAEKGQVVIHESLREKFAVSLRARLPEVEKNSSRMRIEKVLKKI